MLGRDLQSALSDHHVLALGRGDLDVGDADAVSLAVRGVDVVINAAAYTNVDAAETNESEAFHVNAVGTSNLAKAAAEHDARLVTVSTDYVFDGNATTPYSEDAPYAPISAYGRTKAAGERLALAAHPGGTFVVRTAWLYGEHGSNFAKTMLALASSKETWSVVDDQVGQPTWTGDLAAQIVKLIEHDVRPGVYHGTNSGQASWFDFAREILRVAGLDPERITPTTSAAFQRPAPRPSYSVLGHEAWRRVGLDPMRDWREALHASGVARVDHG
jgi:dTDP-4-dehydrorhamnose reductase